MFSSLEKIIFYARCLPLGTAALKHGQGICPRIFANFGKSKTNSREFA